MRFLLFLFSLLLSFGAISQTSAKDPTKQPRINATTTADGNFVGVAHTHAKGDTVAVLNKAGRQATYQPDPKKPDIYPVWQVKKTGSKYVGRYSKRTGNYYRQPVKTE